TGVVVTTMSPGYPAAKAELQEGDVIHSVNQTPAKDLDEFMKHYDASIKAKDPRVFLELARGRGQRSALLKFTYESMLLSTRRREIIGSGVVIGADGLVVAPLGVFHQAIPDEQMKEFKIIVPKKDADEEELDAVFLGRDERSNLAFLKTKDKQNWKPIQFEDAS